MTDWQWQVILALCRIVISIKQPHLFSMQDEDLELLYDAINREET